MTDELQTYGIFDDPLPDEDIWELVGVGAEDLLDAVHIDLSDKAREGY